MSPLKSLAQLFAPVPEDKRDLIDALRLARKRVLELGGDPYEHGGRAFGDPLQVKTLNAIDDALIPHKPCTQEEFARLKRIEGAARDVADDIYNGGDSSKWRVVELMKLVSRYESRERFDW